MPRLEELLRQRDALLAEYREIAERDIADLTEAQEARAAEIEATLEREEDGRTVGLLADIAREQHRADVLARAAAIPGMTQAGHDAPDVRNTGRPGEGVNVNVRSDPFDLSGVERFGERRNREITARAIEVVERSHRFIADEHRERVTQQLRRHGHRDAYSEFVLLGMREEYADGFLRMLLSPNDIRPEERQAIAERHALARSIGLSDVTGVLVPTQLDTTLILANAGRTNPLRQVARQETGTTNVFQAVRTAGATHSWTAEATEVGDNGLDFASPTVTAFKGTVFVPISFEAFEDARDREADVMTTINDAIDDAEASAFVLGNGTNQPRGLITALDANTNAEVLATTANVFGIDDLWKVYEALPPRYRNPRTVWLGNVRVLDDIRQFGTDAYATQTVQLTAAALPPIIGHNIYEASQMEGNIVAARTNNILAVGDPSTYLIYDRLGTSVELVPNLFGVTNGRPLGQRGWLAHHRTGGNLVVGHASSDTVVGWRLLQTFTG